MSADPALLRKAAEIIREGGLSKGLFHTGDGRHCSVGALMEAAHGEKAWQDCLGPGAVIPEVLVLGEVVAPGAGDPWLPLYKWNDALNRTPEQVINAFEQAAQKAEATP